MLRSRIAQLLSAAESTDEDFLNPGYYGALARERDSLADELSEEDRFIRDLSGRIRYLGDYELIEELGRGSMGVVFRARQKSLNREVAVKIIIGAVLASPAERERFRIEAESAAHLSHPNIVPIYEIGRHEEYDYYSMALVKGGTLGGRIKRERFALREAVALMVKIAIAIRAAHQSGVIHRDLKPDNILLDEQGEPHIGDFGLACRLEQKSTLTMTGQIMGTPQYMAPEQVENAGDQITVAVDIHSLGAILYEMLAGTPPFRADSIMGTLELVKSKPPPPLRGHLPTVDIDLETIVHKCLEKSPTDRYRSAYALAEDLEAWLEHRPIAARPPAPVERLFKSIRRRPIHAALLVTAMLLLLTFGIGGPLVAFHQAQLREEVEEQRQQALDNESRARSQARRHRNFAYVANMRLVELMNELGAKGFAAHTMSTSWIPEDGDVNFRGWEWYYTFGKIHKNPVNFHAGASVNSLDFSPGGEWIAFSTPQRTAIRNTLSTISRQVLADEEGHQYSAWSPDGQMLVTLGLSGAVKIWDLATGDIRARLPSTKSFVSVSWGPEGERIASLDPAGGLEIWRLGEAGDPPAAIEQAPGDPTLTRIAWSPDGQYLAAIGSSKEVMVWPIAQLASPPARYRGHEAELTTLAWQDNSVWLATGSQDGMVRIWSVPTGEKILRISEKQLGSINSLTWVAGAGVILATGQNDKRIIRTDLMSQKITELTSSDRAVTAVARNTENFSLALANTGGEVVIQRHGLPVASKLLAEREGRWQSIRWSPKKEAIDCLDAEGRAMRFDFATGKELNNDLLLHSGKLQAAAWNPGGPKIAMITTGESGSKLIVLNPRRNRKRQIIDLDIAYPQSVAWLGRREVLVLGGAGKVLRIDLSRSASPVILQSPSDDGLPSHVAVSASPNRRFILASGADGRFTLWSAETNDVLLDISQSARQGVLKQHAWHPKGSHFALGDSYGRISVWSTEEMKERSQFVTHQGPMAAMAWHPSGQRLASVGKDGKIRLWDWESGEPLLTLKTGRRLVRCLAWDADGRRLAAAGSDGKLRVWDATAGILLSGGLLGSDE